MKKAFSMDQTWLQCIGCGHKADLLGERKFRCPKCNDLFEVKHNYGFLLSYPPPWSLKNFYDNRAKKPNHRDPAWLRSGIWFFKELVMPHLPEEYIVTLGEGNSPIVEAGKHLRDWLRHDNVWLMLKGVNPSGAFKDDGMTVAISTANAAGIKDTACASTGDTSASGGVYSAAAGMKSTVVLPRNFITSAQMVQPQNSGARIITVPGTFDDCNKIVEKLADMGLVYTINSRNPTRIAGHMATVFQLAQFFEWKMEGWVAAPVGNGSNSSSVAEGLRVARDVLKINVSNCHILGCQSAAANPLARSWNTSYLHTDNNKALQTWRTVYLPIKTGETTATAAKIGAPVSREKVMRGIVEFRGAMETVGEEDLNEAVDVCGLDGHFVCPQTGTAIAGVRNAIGNRIIGKNERIVIISTALGLKFTESAGRGKDIHIINAPDCNTETVAKLMGL